MNKYTVPKNARSSDYQAYLQFFEENGLCPFCAITPDSKRILYRDAHFFVMENRYPLKNTKKHYVVIPVKHYTSSHEMESCEWWDFKKALEFLDKKMGRPKGAVGYWRDGDKSISGGSIQHLHFHYAIPEGNMVVQFGEIER